MKTRLAQAICCLVLPSLMVIQTAAAPPAAPQNVQPSWVWSAWTPEALLWWDAAPDATSYNVYYFDETNSVWTSVASGLTEPRYRHSWPPAPPVRYVVTASNADGESAPSAEVVVNGGEYNYNVYPMTIIYWPGYYYPGTVTPTNAQISWMVGQVSGADGMVELGTNGSDLTLVMQNTNYQMWQGVIVTNLTPRTIYWYRITTVGTNRLGLSVTNWFATEDTNHPPVAEPRDISTSLGYPVNVQLYARDNAGYIPDAIESFRIIQGPTNGTLSGTFLPAWNDTADVLYTPARNAPFEDRFWYVANDGELDSAPALVTITNQYINRYPEAGFAVVSTLEGVPVAIEWIGSDPDGDAITFALYTNPPPVGTVSGPLTNMLYTPEPGFVGADYVAYWVSDGSLTALGLIIVDVISTNVAPTAQAQSLTVAENATIEVMLTGQDANGDTLAFFITMPPAHGVLIGAAPALQYQPHANFHGTDQFSFVVNDGQVDSLPGVISLTITPVNYPPVVPDQSVTIDEDYPLALNFLTGSDADGDALTFRVVGGPQHGQIVSSGSVYNPDPDYAGTDMLTFVANDGQADSVPATLTITIRNVDDPPLPNTPDAYTLEDTSTNIVLTAYNPDNDPLTFQLASVPGGESVTIDGANVSFTPNAGQSGTTFFDYAVSDGVYWATGRVLIHITSVEDVPEAYGQSVSTIEDTPVTITLAGVDGDLDPITYFIVSSPANGSLSGTGSSLVYSPNLNFSGADSFTFKVNDGKADSAPATVSIAVTAVNDPPALDPILNYGAAEDAPAITVALTGITSGAANEAATITLTAVSSNPALIPNPTVNYTSPDSTGSVTFRSLTNANGIATITITVSDGAYSASRSFDVQISALNDKPTIDPVATVHILEDAGTQVIQLTGISAGPADEPQSLTVSVASDFEPATGIPTLDYTSPDTTGVITFTPPANAVGLAVIHVTLNDGLVSTVRPIQIIVDPVNDAPVANAQSVTTAYNNAVSFTLTGSDVEGSALAYGLLSVPANGTLTGSAPNFTFTPNLNWSGTTTFTFRVNDGGSNSPAATVTITVNGPTAAPAPPSALTATPVSTSRIDLAWNDNSTSEAGFKIERSSNGSSWTQIATVAPNVRNYSATGLSANKTYYFRVRAYNALGNSAYSNTASAKTLR